MTGFRRLLSAFLALSIAMLTPAVIPAVAPAVADTIRDMQYWLDEYGFREVWPTTKGKGVKVAIIDTGVEGSVRELQGVVVDGTDMSGLGSSDGQTPVGTDSSHGTLVASVLAGRGTGSGSGVIGVAPEVEILSISVAFGKTGDGPSSDDQIADAVVWAVDHGADIINMSLTRNTPDWPRSWDEAFQYAFDNDVVVVAAAGNRGTGTEQVGAPATIPGVLTVAGVDRNGEASFNASSQGITIAVAAPAEQITGVMPSGAYVQWSGTSAAAPIVSGLVALVRAAHPELDANNVIQRVIATAQAQTDEVPSPLYGYGIIDAYAAVSEDVELVDENPMGSLEEWVRLHRRASPDVSPYPSSSNQPIPDPDIDGTFSARSFLPNPHSLAYVTVPLVVLSLFATLGWFLTRTARRQFRRLDGEVDHVRTQDHP